MPRAWRCWSQVRWLCFFNKAPVVVSGFLPKWKSGVSGSRLWVFLLLIHATKIDFRSFSCLMDLFILQAIFNCQTHCVSLCAFDVQIPSTRCYQVITSGMLESKQMHETQGTFGKVAMFWRAWVDFDWEKPGRRRDILGRMKSCTNAYLILSIPALRHMQTDTKSSSTTSQITIIMKMLSVCCVFALYACPCLSPIRLLQHEFLAFFSLLRSEHFCLFSLYLVSFLSGHHRSWSCKCLSNYALGLRFETHARNWSNLTNVLGQVVAAGTSHAPCPEEIWKHWVMHPNSHSVERRPHFLDFALINAMSGISDTDFSGKWPANRTLKRPVMSFWHTWQRMSG